MIYQRVSVLKVVGAPKGEEGGLCQLTALFRVLVAFFGITKALLPYLQARVST